uniref:Uncharacterized protein n=1 Tax=Rhizophora mucronata TaxID=61149 RepID=A0A2P2MT89_RHIMU
MFFFKVSIIVQTVLCFVCGVSLYISSLLECFRRVAACILFSMGGLTHPLLIGEKKSAKSMG